MIRLVIAQAHQGIVEGIKSILKNEEDINVVDTCNNGIDLLKIADRNQPNVILLDVPMLKLDAIEVTEKIKEKHPNIHILAFTMFDQNEIIQQMINAGAIGYLLKTTTPKELIVAIKSVNNGEKYFDKDIKVSELKF